jgi:transposase
MIKVDERERMRRAYFLEGKSIRGIAREMGHSRTTVKRAIESAEEETYTLREPRPAPVLGPYMARIDELLTENEHLPPKQRYTGYKIYEDIYDRGYRGSESGVRRYIGLQRRETKKRKVYMPLEFDKGTDGQVDWGEAQAIIGGIKQTVQVFLMRLCYSRKLFVRSFPTQRGEAFYEGHIQAPGTEGLHCLSQPLSVREPLLHAGTGARKGPSRRRRWLCPPPLHGAYSSGGLLRRTQQPFARRLRG